MRYTRSNPDLPSTTSHENCPLQNFLDDLNYGRACNIILEMKTSCLDSHVEIFKSQICPTDVQLKANMSLELTEPHNDGESHSYSNITIGLEQISMLPEMYVSNGSKTIDHSVGLEDAHDSSEAEVEEPSQGPAAIALEEAMNIINTKSKEKD